MSDPNRHGQRALPDHMTASGDQTAIKITITVAASGALLVEGPLDEREWMLAVLENAKDAVRNHRRPSPIIIPTKDVSL